jgi:hypothetical protein
MTQFAAPRSVGSRVRSGQRPPGHHSRPGRRAGPSHRTGPGRPAGPGRWASLGGRAALVVAVIAWAGLACDSAEFGTGPRPSLESVQGLYDPATLTFDPQGAAPAGDILAALAASGFEPQLNIARTSTFQVPYRDPVTGEFRTLNGTVQTERGGITLTFSSVADANQLLLPRSITLAWDEEEESLHFSGSASVNRIRLQQLFPDLYGEEPWAGESIPGVLTVRFVRTTAGGAP